MAFFKTKRTIWVTCDRFSGSIGKFEEAVNKTHGDSDRAKIYHLAIEMAKTKLKRRKDHE